MGWFKKATHKIFGGSTGGKTTDYGYGITSKRGHLRVNGNRITDLDNRALMAVSSYMNNLEMPKHRASSISIFGHHGNSQWNNLRSEQNKITDELNRRRRSGGVWEPDTNSALHRIDDINKMRTMTPEENRARLRANAIPILQQIAPAQQQVLPETAQTQAQRTYAALISRQRNNQMLGI